MSAQEPKLDLISLDNFDPMGPRDRILNSPRSLKACEYLGIDPAQLFVLNEEELVH